jgi:hypothetical protein
MMLDLSVGGPEWADWYFAPWGRARNWRVHAPDGSSYTAEEIFNLRSLAFDLSFLSHRVKQLADYASADAMHFGPRDAATLIAAMHVIARASQQIGLYRLSGTEKNRQRQESER